MRTLLAKCCVLALIAGGFTFTGDAGRVFARGRRVLESTTLPRDAVEAPFELPHEPAPAPTDMPSAPRVDVAPAVPPESAGAAVTTATEPAPPSASTESPLTHKSPADAPIGTPIPPTSPPATSPETIDLPTLSPGDRVIVWVGAAGARSGRGGGMTIALDVIDPATAEVLEQGHAGTGEQGTNHAPLRRIRILGTVTEGFFGGVMPTGPAGRITRGQSLRIVPVEPSASQHGLGATGAEVIGPVRAMAVARATTAIP